MFTQIFLHCSRPAIYVELPKVWKTQIEYFKIDELNHILNVVKGQVIEIPTVLAIYYGLRRSEIIGLKWSAIDFESKVIEIREKAVQMHGADLEKEDKLTFLKEMKTEASLRTLPLIKEVENYLFAWREKIESNKSFFGSNYNMDYKDYVCVWPNGNIIRPDYITKSFASFSKKLPFEKEKSVTFHGLRHSCATMLLSLGFSIKEIQMWLGHGSYKTTADFYAHLDLYGKSQLGTRLGSVLGKSELVG